MLHDTSASPNVGGRLSSLQTTLIQLRAVPSGLAKRGRRRPLVLLLLLAFAVVLIYETRTSRFEASTISALNSRLTYHIAGGPSTSIVFPSGGPFNQIRGYVELPNFIDRLKTAGFQVLQQAHLSPELALLSRWNITPPYPEPQVAGLKIRGENQLVLFDATHGQRVFSRYEDIPDLVLKAVFLVENRDLADTDVATQNPAVDWIRLGKASLTYAGNKIGLPVHVEGGSTLATQIEKYRHSSGGRTASAADKLRQVVGASLRSYIQGPDTRAERREIVIDYLNSIPLSATPRYGEVYGLGNGLYAWFGIELADARQALADSAPDGEKAKIFKHMLALICATRGPSFYLLQDHHALENRVAYYARQLQAAGIIAADFERAVEVQKLEFLPHAPQRPAADFVRQKAVNAIRYHLMGLLGVPSLYTLDRLHLDVDTTLNIQLQNRILDVFDALKDPAFVSANGLKQAQLLESGSAPGVAYSFTLFERTPAGNLLRVQADTLNQPFDLNSGMKLELGSTAKLRTLAHYLELIAGLYGENRNLASAALKAKSLAAPDPITTWTLGTMSANPSMTLSDLLENALERKYSASPGEVFFTGGGAHVFANFDSNEDHQVYTLRDAFAHSVNLTYIRLLRDLVKFHEARLPYDPQAVLRDPDSPVRVRLLHEIADKESRDTLLSSYQTYNRLDAQKIVASVLSGKSRTPRTLAMLYFAWNPESDAARLGQWLELQGTPVSAEEAAKLLKSYDPKRLNISDYGYLLNRNPLDLWCAGQVMAHPGISWDELLNVSNATREVASRWLFKTRNRNAQDLRLRIRFEQDAFARMTPYWKSLGFPFDHLVPSLATAIGSSADRPLALTDLIGIIVNDGIRMPDVRIAKLEFGTNTPYETILGYQPQSSTRVMAPEVARLLRESLADVVESGTAHRLAGVFKDRAGMPIIVGGKTGSGDNRYETRKFSRAVSRTGTFAFFIGDRYFGVITAYVGQDKAAEYGFTSALPISILKLLAADLSQL